MTPRIPAKAYHTQLIALRQHILHALYLHNPRKAHLTASVQGP